MIKNITYIITIFILVFFATSCCPSSRDLKIENDDKLKINENDIFIYKSNFNNYDTLYIEEIKSENKYRYTAENLCGNHVDKEQLIYFFQNYTNSFPEDSLLYLTLSYGTYDKILTLRLGHWGVNPYTGDIHLGSVGTSINKFYLGDSIYDNVRYCRMTDNKANNKVYKIFFNIKYGIISYEYKTNEIYALFKIIPKK